MLSGAFYNEKGCFSLCWVCQGLAQLGVKVGFISECVISGFLPVNKGKQGAGGGFVWQGSVW